MPIPDISADGRGSWFVLHTRTNQEKPLARDLKARGIDHFLPLVPAVRYRGKKKLKADWPLFPGYLFLRGSIDDAYTADRGGRVAHIIPVADQRRLIWELQNLAKAIEHGVPLDPYPYLKKGIGVEITSGPLRGLQGMIESRTSLDRLILAVEMLGQGVSVELHGAVVEPI